MKFTSEDAMKRTAEARKRGELPNFTMEEAMALLGPKSGDEGASMLMALAEVAGIPLEMPKARVAWARMSERDRETTKWMFKIKCPEQAKDWGVK